MSFNVGDEVKIVGKFECFSVHGAAFIVQINPSWLYPYEVGFSDGFGGVFKSSELVAAAQQVVANGTPLTNVAANPTSKFKIGDVVQIALGTDRYGIPKEQTDFLVTSISPSSYYFKNTTKFSCPEWSYPRTEEHNLEFYTGSEHFYEGLATPIDALAGTSQQRCSCDFVTQILPYDCSCGGS